MSRRRWATLSADEAMMLAKFCALDNYGCGRITRAEFDQHMEMLEHPQPRRAWGDSWPKVILAAILIAAAVVLWAPLVRP